MKDWNSRLYDQNFQFVADYGKSLLDLIDFEKVESAIDLGCGTGKLTDALAKHHLDVLGLDASASQRAKAKKNYPALFFRQEDATSFKVAHPVDLVFSNALFHWIKEEDQEKMLKAISEALKSEGQLVFECGGHGNNAMIHQALAKVFKNHGYAYAMPFYFPTIGEYASLVEKAGLQVVQAYLFERPTPLIGEDGLAKWIEMFIQAPFEAIDGVEKETMINEVVALLRDDLEHEGTWYADYVRLRMKAIKL
jgi:trans-aconitate methyltransferase